MRRWEDLDDIRTPPPISRLGLVAARMVSTPLEAARTKWPPGTFSATAPL